MSAMDDAAAGTTEPGPGDVATIDTLRRMWELRDPVPDDLADRVAFVLSMENLDAELMLLAEELQPAGTRAEDRARNVTFSSEHLSVMVTITDEDPAVRLDGWIGEGAGVEVALRSAQPGGSAGGDEQTATTADEDGRFCFSGVPHGLVQLVFRPTPVTTLRLLRPVVTPAVQI